MKTVRHLWLAFAYYFSWFLFGLGGLVLNLGSALFIKASQRERFGPFARRSMRWMFDLWLRWMHFSGVVRVTWKGFDAPLPTGTVYVANHPTLVDAPFLLARLPDAVCIFKPALLQNPLIGPAAILAGFVSADSGVDMIRNAAQRVATGQSLLIFPEGTRTNPGAELNPLKPAFALIARLAQAPVQIIRVRTGERMARKGWPWWCLPPVPGWFEFTLDELIPATEIGRPSELSERIEALLRAPFAVEEALPSPRGDVGAAPLQPPFAARFQTHRGLKKWGTPVGMCAFFMLYFAVLRHPFFPVTTMPLTALDRWISFQPTSLILYASLWLYVPLLPALFVERRALFRYAWAVALLSGLAMGIFILWPTRSPTPDIDWTQHAAFGFLKTIDASGNACPSLHAAFAVFNTVGFHKLLRQLEAGVRLRWANVLWSVGIVYSALATKQHVALDIFAGLLLGAAVAWGTFGDRQV